MQEMIDKADLYKMFSDLRAGYGEEKRKLDEFRKTLEILALRVIKEITGISEGSIVKDRDGTLYKITSIAPQLMGYSFFDFTELRDLGLGVNLYGKKKTKKGWHKKIFELWRGPIEVVLDSGEQLEELKNEKRG